jgi:glycosyltransferase involved in cell wall biosynthesis
METEARPTHNEPRHPELRAGLRVTFITHYTELYGANLSLLNLIEGLSRYGVAPHVVCPEGGELLGELGARGVPTAIVPFEWWVSPHRSGGATRLFRNVRRLRPLVTRLADWRTDLVYSNSSVFAVGALAALELEVPHVWHAREFGRRDYDLWPDLGLQMSRLVFRTAEALVCVSHALRRALLGKNPPANARVIYNGVAWEADFDRRRRAAEALRDRRQPFTFALVGRFRESKGQAVAIRAFAELARRRPDVRLLLVGGAGGTGDQGYMDGCRALAAELGIQDRVEFWGYVPDPERAFLAADAALMCSRSEAMGRVTAEAMSACRPVIGFDAGGTSELIDPGRTGLLYSDPGSLVECMLRYTSDPGEAVRHGAAGWTVARARHSVESYAAQIAAVLCEVADDRRGAKHR